MGRKGAYVKNHEVYGRAIPILVLPVTARLLPDNPYDGHMLADTLTATGGVTGVGLTDVYVDKWYREARKRAGTP